MATRTMLALAGLTAAVLTGVGLVRPGASVPSARADDVTISQDALRTGWDATETAMSPSAVKSFTQLFTDRVNGQVYAQPLVIDQLATVIVATETDDVYAFDSITGARIWHVSLGIPYRVRGCGDLAPDSGITGTPVYDPAAGTHGTLYLLALTGGRAHPAWAIWAVNPVTGASKRVRVVSGHPANDPHITFNPAAELARPGLLLMNGWVYAAFGSYCDTPPYAGYVAGIKVTTGKLALWTDESEVTNDKAGIWQSGGGVMSDGPGRIFVTSGNGVSPGYGPGSKPPGTLAESVIRLSVKATTGALRAIDFFSPNNAPFLDAGDHDFGSGGPVGLPFGVSGGKGQQAYPHLLVQAGKDGRIYILNRDHLGGRTKTNSRALYVSPVYSGLFGHPAIFAATPRLTEANAPTAGDYMFYVGRQDVLRVFRFKVTAKGLPTLADVANSSLVYGYTSGSPIVTSDGANSASAVLWEIYTPHASGTRSVLEAYDVSGTALAHCTVTRPCKLSPIFSAPIGTAAKFSVVATSGGRVYVGTRGGRLLAFGARTAAAPLAGTTTALGATPVGTTTARTVNVTATKTTTITAVRAATGASNAPLSSQFSVTGLTLTRAGSVTPAPVTPPVRLTAGDLLAVRVTFRPAAPGGSDGTLVLTDSSAPDPVVEIPLTANGTRPGLYAQPTSLSFPLAPDQGITEVPVGISVPGTVVVSNFGTAAYEITSVHSPDGPFSFTVGGTAPARGQRLAPGESISVAVSYTPIAPGPATGSFTITGTSDGRSISTAVGLSGVGTAAVGRLTAPAVDFGSIRVGHEATRYVHVTNTGNTPASITGVPALPVPFRATLTPRPGLPLNPGYDLVLPVSFTPRQAGNFKIYYQLKWSDLSGTHVLSVPLIGTAT